MLAVQGCTNVKEMGRKEKLAVGMVGINVELKHNESIIKTQTYPTENNPLFIALLQCASATIHFAINISIQTHRYPSCTSSILFAASLFSPTLIFSPLNFDTHIINDNKFR